MRRQGEGTVSNGPRGVLLLSPFGCGKSQFATAPGNETGRPTVVLDVGHLSGSLVGQSGGNVRAALKSADATARCVLLCDEIEKALAGATSSGQTDSVVTARLFGSLVAWLNDHASDVFFVGTCNDASKLPPGAGAGQSWYFAKISGHPLLSVNSRISRLIRFRSGLSSSIGNPMQLRGETSGRTTILLRNCVFE